MTLQKITIALTAGLMTLPVFGSDSPAGVSYGVDMRVIGTSTWTRACLRFSDDGRLAIQRSALDMVWQDAREQAGRFAAVTRPKQAVLLDYQLGLHAEFIAGPVIAGTSVDSLGNAAVFFGGPDANCDAATRPADVATTLMGLATPWTGQFAGPEDSGVETASFMELSKLTGRSFAVVTVDDTGRTNATCWGFAADGSVRNDSTVATAWAPDYGGETRVGFQVISRGQHLYGTLVGDTLIEVQGIDANGNEPSVIHGFGDEVEACAGPER